MDFITIVMESGDIHRACITCFDCNTWIASERSILLNLKEVELLYRYLTQKEINMPLKFKNKTYAIETNDGFTLQCVSNVSNEYLYVGKTRQYIILFTTQTLKGKDTCVVELDWIRNHIKDEGM